VKPTVCETPEVADLDDLVRRARFCSRMALIWAEVCDDSRRRLSQRGSFTFMQSAFCDRFFTPTPDCQRIYPELRLCGKTTTTVDQVALDFTAPSNLPPPKFYEKAIRVELL